MSRTIINIIVDMAAALLFLGMIATGYILRFTLPPGSNRAFSLWGLTRHQYGDMHFWTSFGLLTVLAVHLMLHWKWIVTAIVKHYHGVQTSPPSLIYSGVLTLAIATLIFMAFAWTVQHNVKQIARPIRESGTNSPFDGQTDSSPIVPSENGNSEVDFRKHIYPIFEKNCLPCHGPQKQYAGFRADRGENFFRNISNKPLILPGQSDASSLIAIVSGAREDLPMADVHRLPEHEVLLLRAWIDAGAKWPASLPEK
ncbi:MAG: DUF4405 domain-containing protein [Methylobacter sp.]